MAITKQLLARLFSIRDKGEYKVFAILGIKISIKNKYFKSRMKVLEERILALEMAKVMESGLWDAKYYIQNYHPEMKKHKALVHYMTKGYKKHENPSKIFNAKKYKLDSKNPIIDYLTCGRYSLHMLYYKNEFKAPQCIIDKYNFDKQNRKSKKVIYTCITNNYDDLYELSAYYYTDTCWDYICYTDNEEYIRQGRIGIWEIRPLYYTDLDNSRNNRWHKTHPHILFPDYEESVYIDANINILTPKFFNLVNSTNDDILLPIHSSRVCLYKELDWAEEMGFDRKEKIQEQYSIIKKSGFPENYGMFENNIIYRKHHKQEIIDMMEEWWSFIKDYCQRDQTSLAYLFWKNNRKIEDYAFENTRIDYLNYCIFSHKKGYSLCKS